MEISFEGRILVSEMEWIPCGDRNSVAPNVLCNVELSNKQDTFCPKWHVCVLFNPWNQDIPLIRAHLWSGCITNKDTSLIRTSYIILLCQKNKSYNQQVLSINSLTTALPAVSGPSTSDTTGSSPPTEVVGVKSVIPRRYMGKKEKGVYVISEGCGVLVGHCIQQEILVEEKILWFWLPLLSTTFTVYYTQFSKGFPHKFPLYGINLQEGIIVQESLTN